MFNPSFAGDVELSSEKIFSCFNAEALRFAEVINAPELSGAVTEYLRSADSDDKGDRGKVRQPRGMKGRHVVDVGDYSSWLWEILASAQIAVCCDLFRDCSISLENINQDEMGVLARDVVNRFLNSAGHEANNILKIKLQVADTVRIIQILRKLGLYSRPAYSTKQLCMGAGLGIRDIDAMHVELWLQQGAPNNLVSGCLTSRYVTFHTRFPGVGHAILIDCAPALAELYEEINSKSGGKVVALNQDLFSAFSWMAGKIESGQLEGRNVVVGYRIDHRMIPDVPEFFEKLSAVLGSTADFIVSIGAGNNVDEFRGRTEKIREIEGYLRKRGLDPVRIKLCRGETLDEQRNNPLFGLLEITSYEVLYCKLRRKKIGSH